MPTTSSDRHGRIDAVLIEQVDPVGTQPGQGRVADSADIGRAGIEALRGVAVPEAELGRDDHLVPDGFQGLAHHLLVAALLHKSGDGRGYPFPGQTYPTASVIGMPSAV